jgi:hypothetical protein
MRLVSGLLACLLLAGCGGGGGGNGRPAASPSPPVVSVPDPSATPGGALPSVIDSIVDNPPGSIACARLAAAVAAGSFMTPGVVDGIVAASATADAPLADAAHRLGDAYDAAIAAAHKADEPDKIAAVGAAASDMSGVCADSGLQTVG